MRSGICHFDAYSLLDAERIEDVIGMVVRRMHRLCGESESSPNPVQRLFGDGVDFGENIVGAFYWTPRAEFADGHYGSSGVMLYVVDEEPHPESVSLKSPITRLPARSRVRGDYEADCIIHLPGKYSKTELEQEVWQQIRKSMSLGDAELVEVKVRAGPGHPNILKIRRSIIDVTEDEAMCRCMEVQSGFKTSLGDDGNLYGRHDSNDGMVSFAMCRRA